MTIPSLQFIENKAKENGLVMINGYSGPPPFQVDICISENVLDDFLSLVKELGKTFFFFDTIIYDKESLEGYCIDLDLITVNAYGEVAKLIKKEAQKHNKLLRSLPTEKPASIELFTFADGCLYSLEFNEEWNDLIKEPIDVLRGICSRYDEEIKNYKKQKSDNEAQKLKDIEREIINDSTFLHCSTKDARLRFVYKFISDKSISLNINRVEMQAWVDLLWAQLKSKK